jgi:hypothetical protein
VPTTDPVVSALYNVSQQSMPSGPLIAAFLPSQQTAISQLASAYCGELLASASLTHTFFNGGLDGSLGLQASTFFGASPSAHRTMLASALVNNAIGTNVNPQGAAAAQAEVDKLLTRIPTLSPSATVGQASIAACTAVLGSAVVTLQ